MKSKVGVSNPCKHMTILLPQGNGITRGMRWGGGGGGEGRIQAEEFYSKSGRIQSRHSQEFKVCKTQPFPHGLYICVNT